jgi:hypothetical protein
MHRQACDRSSGGGWAGLALSRAARTGLGGTTVRKFLNSFLPEAGLVVRREASELRVRAEDLRREDKAPPHGEYLVESELREAGT